MGDDGVIPNISGELQSRVLESPTSITIFALVCKDMNYNRQMGFDSCNRDRKALNMERKVTKRGPNEATSIKRRKVVIDERAQTNDQWYLCIIETE